MANEKLNMRGWTRINIHSTKLSTFAKFRENYKLLERFKDADPCMWEFTVRWPQSKKKANR